MIRSRTLLLPVCAAACTAVFGSAQTTLTESLRIPAPFHPDNPGWEAGLSGVDVSGDRFAIGATRMAEGPAGTSAADVGAVYVMRMVSGTPVFETELRPPTNVPAQFFGRELSLDGDRLAVGSIGAVEVFERDPVSGWQHTATLSRSVLSRSISLSGSRLAIGNWDATVRGASMAGEVEVYRRRADASWVLEATLTDPTAHANDTLGKHVDLSDNRLATYSANYTAGFASPSAMVFARRNGVWQLEAELRPNWAGGTFRLSSIDLSGNTIVIQGTPLLAVFDRQGSTWTQVQTIDKRIWGFGPTDRYQDLSGDRLVIASLERVQNGPGAVSLVFERVGGVFVKQAVLSQTDGSLLTAPAIDGDLVAMVSADAVSGCLLTSPPTCGVGATFVYSLAGLGQSYGVGCPGGFLPTLGVPGVPDLETSRWDQGASTLQIHVCNATPAATALVMIGSNPGVTPLGGGCTLGVDTLPILLGPLQISGSPNGAAGTGSLATALQVPSNFRGQLTAQVLILDPAAGNGAFSITRSTLVRIP